MSMLIASLLALAAGPLLVSRVKGRAAAAVAIDAFVVVSTGGLVLIHILPESLTHGGWLAFAATIVGLFGPLWAERELHSSSHGNATGSGRFIVVLALLGLAAHAVLDGLAIGHDHGVPDVLDHAGHDHSGHNHGAHDHGGDSGSLIAWAVVFHRLPVSISIWWLIPRTLGKKVAIGTLILIAAATVGGFFLSGMAMGDGLSAHGLAIFQALLAGSLLHVVLHSHLPPVQGSRNAWQPASLLGTAIGIAMLFLVGRTHPSEVVSQAGDVFFQLALQSAPALLVAYLGVGLVHVFVSSRSLSFLKRGGSFTQSLRGVIAGLPLPVCSCGIVPLYREIVAKGVPLAAALAFLVATPELEIAAFFLSWKLLGPELAFIRLGAAAILALSIGWAMGAWTKSKRASAIEDAMEDANAESQALVPPEPSGESKPAALLRALRFGFGEAVDHTGAWIILGIGMAALLSPYLAPLDLANQSTVPQVILAALIGLPLYVCASGSTPLAAVLLVGGLSPGAVLAFLLTGPATNLTTFGMLARLHGRSVALAFAGGMALLAIGLGFGVNALVGGSLTPLINPTEHVYGAWWEIAALAILAATFLISLARQGTRRFIENVSFDAAAHEAHAHAHGHEGHTHA